MGANSSTNQGRMICEPNFKDLQALAAEEKVLTRRCNEVECRLNSIRESIVDLECHLHDVHGSRDVAESNLRLNTLKCDLEEQELLVNNVRQLLYDVKCKIASLSPNNRIQLEAIQRKHSCILSANLLHHHSEWARTHNYKYINTKDILAIGQETNDDWILFNKESLLVPPDISANEQDRNSTQKTPMDLYALYNQIQDAIHKNSEPGVIAELWFEYFLLLRNKFTQGPSSSGSVQRSCIKDKNEHGSKEITSNNLGGNVSEDQKSHDHDDDDLVEKEREFLKLEFTHFGNILNMQQELKIFKERLHFQRTNISSWMSK